MTLGLARVIAASGARAQGVAMGSGPRPGIKPIQCKGRGIPQLEDITQKAGIRFTHSSAPENRYIVESMSGGVILVDYDRDGWPDIYFTNAPTVEMALRGETAPGALYHNNHDGTFTDVTARSGMQTPCLDRKSTRLNSSHITISYAVFCLKKKKKDEKKKVMTKNKRQ